MERPPTPADEARRLASLHALALLDAGQDAVLERYTRVLARALEVPIALVTLVDEQQQCFVARTGLQALSTGRDESFCAHAVASGELLVVPDTRLDPRFHDNPLVVGDPRIRSYAGVPVRAPDGALVGTLCALDRRPRHHDERELAILVDLGALLEGELATRALATTDELTGLRNRRGLRAAAPQVLRWAEAHDRAASLVLVDLDRLKQRNDAHGHVAGDRAIVAVARALRSAFGAAEVLARLGGDEMVALVVADEREVAEGCARLAAALAAMRPPPGEPPYAATSGAATRRPGGVDLDELLAQADARLIDGKRDRIDPPAAEAKAVEDREPRP